MTETEFFNGILNAKNVEDNTIVFLREIENIETDQMIINKNPSLASRFIELDDDNRIDEDSKKYLDELKYEKIKKVLPSTHIHSLKVKKEERKKFDLSTTILFRLDGIQIMGFHKKPIKSISKILAKHFMIQLRI